MEAVIARLEAVTTRLESVEGRSSSTPSTPANFTPPKFGVALPGLATPGKPLRPSSGGAASSSSGGSNVLSDWDAEVVPGLREFQGTAESIGGDVAKASQVLEKAFQAERNVIDAISQCQKPDQVGLQNLVAPVGAQMQLASALTEGKRTAAFNHNKAVAESLQALSWVVYSGPSCGMNLPTQHVEEAWQSAEFWANKVLMEFRNREPAHVNWVRQLKQVFTSLGAYVQKHHCTGPAWNAAGKPVANFTPSAAGPESAADKPAAASNPAPRAPGGAPPPPPPPAAGLLSKQKTGPVAGGAGLGAVFSAINKKGEGVTAGLRKVTDDMKTKNRADRSGVVPALNLKPTAAGPTIAPAATGGKAKKAARTECEQGRKWIVENHEGNQSIIIDDTSPKQTLYIYKCTGCTIQVKGKLNAITIDQCTKTGLVFQDLVASCELVNSSSLQVQVTGLVPTVAIDKCDGVQLYLSKESLDSSVTTAKSSAVNVLVPGVEGGDMVELYIPEQFISTFKDGKCITEPISYSGG